MTARSALKKLYTLFTRREKVKVVGLLGLMIISAIMEMIGIGAIPAFILVVASPEKVLLHPITGPVAEWFGVSNSRELLITGSVVLIAVFVFKGLLAMFILYVKTRFVQHKYIELSGRLFASYLFSPYAFHLHRNSSELLRNVLSESGQVVNSVLMPLLHIVLSGVTMLFIAALLLVVEPLFSIIALVTLGGVSMISMRVLKKKTSAYGKQEVELRQVTNKAVLEGLFGIKEARVLGREEDFLFRFNHSIKLMARAQFFIRMVQGAIRPLFETITVMGVLGLALVLTAKDESIEGIIAVLALFAAATYRLMPTFNQMLQHITTFRYHIYSVHPVYNDVQELSDRMEAPGDINLEPLPFTSEIVFENVSYKYPESEEKVLDKINLSIPQGTAIGLVGGSGAGKTTLVDALLGLLTIAQGSIRVDGVNIYDNKRAWQKNIGYIPQTIYLIDDSLKKNVAFGLQEDQIDEDAFNEAVNAAQLTDLINRLPEKEHTVIGEQGVRLSGGQRQRIGIARALYHKPQLLVMDEGTSALDNITEKYVIQAIEKLKGSRTLIIIAHRLTTVMNCDRLYLLENGGITDEGTYAELLARNSRFREMAKEKSIDD